MPGVIVDAGQTLNHQGDPRQGPQVSGESVRPCSPQQLPLQHLHLILGEARQASRTPGSLQPIAPLLLPGAVPGDRALTRRADAACHFGGEQTLHEESRRLQTPLLQRLEITPGTDTNISTGCTAATGSGRVLRHASIIAQMFTVLHEAL